MDKSISISLYLLHPALSGYDEALISTAGLKSFDIKAEFNFEARLYISESKPSVPDWVLLLEEGFEGIPAIKNVYNGAVIICKVENRYFAITFGNGRYLLNPLYKEHRFGLKVAMTLFSETGLRSATTKRKVSDYMIATICQSSREVPLDQLRVTENIDRITGLAGKPSDISIADRVEGKDSLSLKMKINFHRFQDNLKDLLKRYQEDIPQYFKKYTIKEQQIYDPEIIKTLDEDLCMVLNNNEKRVTILFVSPEFIDYDQVDIFYFTKNFPPKTGEEQDLGGFLDEADFDAICNAETWSPESLKKAHIGYKNSNDNVIRWVWSLYQCLEYDTKLEEKTCLFSEGTWYYIEQKEMEKYNSIIQKYSNGSGTLPGLGSDKKEGDYNSRVAKENEKVLLMDKKLILPKGASSSIEFCDLFSSDREIIHIKMADGSSNISHLFSQGTVSADLFLVNVQFRTDVQEKVIIAILEKYSIKEKLREIIPLLQSIYLMQPKDESKIQSIKNELMEFIPESKIDQIIDMVKEYLPLIPKDGIKPADYTIVYGIISKKKKSVTKSLPFFSKVNFAHHASLLETMGFKPRISMIS